MKNALLIGTLTALVTGILIATQATLSNRGGNIIGPIRTGILTNLGSGLFALVFILVTIIWHTLEWRNLPQTTVWMLLFSGGLGVLIVVGVILWLINRFMPMAGSIKTILNAVVVIAVIFWLLNVFGVLSSLSRIRVGG